MEENSFCRARLRGASFVDRLRESCMVPSPLSAIIDSPKNHYSNLQCFRCLCLCLCSDMRPLIWHLWYETSSMTPLIWDLWDDTSDMRPLIWFFWYDTSDMRSLIWHLWYETPYLGSFPGSFYFVLFLYYFHIFCVFSLNMRLALRVLTHIWKSTRSDVPGRGGFFCRQAAWILHGTFTSLSYNRFPRNSLQ